MEADAAQRACFESGIKFGSLYHQFAGTPVTPESAPSLAAAMEATITNQPHCVDVAVIVQTDALADAVAEGPADYVELTGCFLDVTIAVECDGWRVEGRMAPDDAGYPLMRIAELRRIDGEDRSGN